MKRVLIIGNTGSGKTTFAKKLADVTALPLIHLDKLFWHGTWEQKSRAEFDEILQNELEKERWIMDGNYNRTISHRAKYCDTIIFFDLPTVHCLIGITKRIFESYGKTREDMGGNCPEKFDMHKLALYRNTIRFRREHRDEYLQFLASLENVNVVIFKRRKDAEIFLTSVPAWR